MSLPLLWLNRPCYRVGQKGGTYMPCVDICLMLVLSLEITEVGATRTKQLIFFAILLMFGKAFQQTGPATLTARVL